jgi:hypothetical protein
MTDTTREQAHRLIERLGSRISTTTPGALWEAEDEFIAFFEKERTHTQALVAAALTEAAELAQRDEELRVVSHAKWEETNDESLLYERIRALISSDTQAALDAHVREERIEEAKWWFPAWEDHKDYEDLDGQQKVCECEKCKRLAQLKERP